MQIAVSRLRSDKIAMACLVVVVLFVVVAVFAPLLTKLFEVELDGGVPSEDLDQFNFPLIGPPDHGFTWEAPLGISPNEADDNLAEWFYGARTSLTVATVSTGRDAPRCHDRAARRLQPRLARQGHQLHDRRVPVAALLLVALALSPIIVSRFGNDPDQLKFWQFGSCSSCPPCSAG